MARKAESYKLVEKTVKERKTKETKTVKCIVLYNNVEPTPAEQKMIDFYLLNGYTPMFEEKKSGTKVEDMRKEMDEETLAKFNAAYKEKGGFHKACKIYAEWKKANNKKEEEKK